MAEALAPAQLVVGRYAIFDKIAAGGMATVHIGRLLGTVGFSRTVAIKRLHAQYAQDPEFVAMFLDEARLAARIHHPNVVSILDVVALEGEVFLVLEYIRGESVARLARAARALGRPVPPEIASTVMAAALRGLHAAHEARGEHGEPLGIVHRDVSPQNIIVGADGVTRVLDFGVAKAAGRMQSTTRDGQLKGKMAYMPPEQVRGKADRRTDTYAAAVVLWELLTSTRLFDSTNDLELLDKLVNEVVAPPSSVVPGISPELDALVMRGLSRDPDARFQTAHDMAEALEEIMPTVSSAKVGAWVESLAQESISGRSRRIEEIESNSSVLPVPQKVPVAVPVDVDEPTTDLGTGTVSKRSTLRPRRRALLVPAMIAGGVVAIVIAIIATRHDTTPATVVPPIPSAPPPASTTAPITPAVSIATPLPSATSSATPPPRVTSTVHPTRPPPATTKHTDVYEHM